VEESGFRALADFRGGVAMAVSSGRWEEADAERFVRELFEHVLRLNPPPEGEVTAWTKRALEAGDPVAIFRALIDLPVHKRQFAADRDAGTRWPPGHFYSPAASRQEISADRDRIFAPRALLGINLRSNEQLELLSRLVPFFGTIPFADERTPPYRYYYRNPSYNYGDAVVYWAMLNHFRPRRIIEVGSGFSSALALDAIDILGLPTACTFIDPYPEAAEQTTAPLREPHRIIPTRIQDIDPDEVKSLEEDDLLFIDSSHVLKTGSDVHFELTELLPRLRRGVLVHFHDMFYSFEYPERWTIEENFGWNELYVVHVFLMFNSIFRIEYFNQYVARKYAAELQKILPAQAPRVLLNPGGGLWLRRV
jgi:Methyltransferase domain